jgi:hypothetical protein
MRKDRQSRKPVEGRSADLNDIALRDFGLMLAALTLGRLASTFHATDAGERVAAAQLAPPPATPLRAPALAPARSAPRPGCDGCRGPRRSAHPPAPLAWATIIIGASLLTPLGFFLIPLWLIVVGLWLSRGKTTSPEPIVSAQPYGEDLVGGPVVRSEDAG